MSLIKKKSLFFSLKYQIGAILMINSISGIILAGGANKRFNGMTKSNIVIQGKTIISRIIDTIRDLFDEIIIVTNTMEEFNDFTNLELVSDQFLNAGPLGGIHAAMKKSSKDALFVFAGDMPFLDKKLITDQMEYYLKYKCQVLVPQVNRNIEPLHAIYNKSVLKDLENFLSEQNSYAVRDFLKRMNVRYMKINETPGNKLAFTNINSPSELKKFQGTPG